VEHPYAGQVPTVFCGQLIVDEGVKKSAAQQMAVLMR